MTNTAETTKEQTAKQSAKTARIKATKVPTPKVEPPQAVKAKEPKPAKGKVKGESSDRLPATIEEMKASKGGLVCYLFLSGKDKAETAKELKAAFNLSDAQAAKITRRITGRVRFYRRVFELMAVK
jgi:hypothetical protein